MMKLIKKNEIIKTEAHVPPQTRTFLNVRWREEKKTKCFVQLASGTPNFTFNLLTVNCLLAFQHTQQKLFYIIPIH